MEKMKTLADQLREQMSRPVEKTLPAGGIAGTAPVKKPSKNTVKPADTAFLQALLDYDNSAHKSMVHARFDKQTADILNKFKMATGVGVSKFVSYAVRHFVDTHPEVKSTIKQYIENTDL
jgi:hypothetical protein